MIHVSCLVESSDRGVSFTWARGPDAFEPYSLTRAARDAFLEAADAARLAFEDVLDAWLRRAGADDEYRGRCAALAAAGFALRESVFGPDRGAGRAREVADWLAAERAADPDCCVEF